MDLIKNNLDKYRIYRQELYQNNSNEYDRSRFDFCSKNRKMIADDENIDLLNIDLLSQIPSTTTTTISCDRNYSSITTIEADNFVPTDYNGNTTKLSNRSDFGIKRRRRYSMHVGGGHRRERIPEGTLCVVCSDQASGIHYSVASCNGCKTFFRRALVNKQQFRCQYNSGCLVDKSVRCGCRSCRLAKCFSSGMDPTAIQHDRDKIRYTKRISKIKAVNDANIQTKVDDVTSPTNVYTDATIINSISIVTTSSMTVGSIGNSPGNDSMTTIESIDGNISSPQSLSCRPYSTDECDALRDEIVELVDQLLILEAKVNIVRLSDFSPHTSAASALYEPRLFEDNNWMERHKEPIEWTVDNYRNADRDDVRRWFLRDLTMMIEWSKCLPVMRELLLNDKMALIKTFAPIYPLLHLAFYAQTTVNTSITSNRFAADNCTITASSSSTPTKLLNVDRNRLIYPDGVYLERDRSICSNESRSPMSTLLIDGINNRFRQMNIGSSELVLYKLMLFYNPDSEGLSTAAKCTINAERQTLLMYLYRHVASCHGDAKAAEIYATLLMMTPTLNRAATLLKRIYDLTHIFNSSNSSDLFDQLILAGL